jgi:hypothetical protein
MILIHELSEKQKRQQDAKNYNLDRANSSYHAGIQMRDHFYKTVYATSALNQPYSFDQHFKEYKVNEKIQKKGEGEQ